MNTYLLKGTLTYTSRKVHIPKIVFEGEYTIELLSQGTTILKGRIKLPTYIFALVVVHLQLFNNC